MTNKKEPNYVGQVIIERGFKTAVEAAAWMEDLEERFGYEGSSFNVETHLWEPASPIGAKEVER
jgi:hypothetical protein